MLTTEALAILELQRGATKDEVKAAYHRLAKLSHPDVMAPAQRLQAEARFKQVSEAYKSLSSDTRPVRYSSAAAAHQHAFARPAPGFIRRGSTAYYGLAGLPFIILVGATISLGGARVASAYQKSKEDSTSYNPFLP